jgi:hypothetical protein
LAIGDNETYFGMLSVLACNFSNNTAKIKRGGGVAVIHGIVSIHESRFTNNKAHLGGEALFTNVSSIVNISRTDFNGNSAISDGLGCDGAGQGLNCVMELCLWQGLNCLYPIAPLAKIQIFTEVHCVCCGAPMSYKTVDSTLIKQ